MMIIAMAMLKPIFRRQSMVREWVHLVFEKRKMPMNTPQQSSINEMVTGESAGFSEYGMPRPLQFRISKPEWVHPGCYLILSMHHCGASRKGSTKT